MFIFVSVTLNLLFWPDEISGTFFVSAVVKNPNIMTVKKKILLRLLAHEIVWSLEQNLIDDI